MSLAKYTRKRDFTKTNEPRGRVSGVAGNRFVIQKHAASRLHYDFRLESGGTLKSWAVPKGVPYAKGERRLAVEVEDHPIAYIDFEGTIPQGQYGGGTVMVWDRGTFESPGDSPAKELAGGKLHFTLSGTKLRGEWYLVRLRDGKQWLLIKGGRDMKPVSQKQDDTSALSGKSMAELAKSGREWNSDRQTDHKSGTSRTPRTRPVSSEAPKSSGEFIEPMKARLLEEPPSGKWIYEIKFDGFRALVSKHGDRVQMLSRNNKDLNGKFPEIAEAVGQLNTRDLTMDGEIVALDGKGRSSFQLLQARELGETQPMICFCAFDLLDLEGENLMEEPLAARKARLEKVLEDAPEAIRYSGSLGENAKALLPKVRRLGLEGLIGKRKDSVYEPGRRSGAWIKLKLHHEQEMVIGGYTDPEGGREHFGALLIGYRENKRLKFAGKVGTGFNRRLLGALNSRFGKIASGTCPFANVPEKNAGRYGQNLTHFEMRHCHWLKPTLVCQVKFSEWTSGGKLRQPVFLGLREDKNADEVVRETAG